MHCTDDLNKLISELDICPIESNKYVHIYSNITCSMKLYFCIGDLSEGTGWFVTIQNECLLQCTNVKPMIRYDSHCY